MIFDENIQRLTTAYDVENNPKALLYIRRQGNHYDGLIPKPRLASPTPSF